MDRAALQVCGPLDLSGELMSDYSELKRLAYAATPQNFDSAEEKAENGYIECPHCGGSGEVELEADYCNYDGAAIGVQFYGIGHEFCAAEAFYRAANPAAVLALIAENERLSKDAKYWSEAHDRELAWSAQLIEEREDLRKERDRLAEDNRALLESPGDAL